MGKKALQYVISHDDDQVFFWSYLALSIVLTLLFNMGLFVILVGFHYLLHIVKHYSLTKSLTLAWVYSTKELTVDMMFVMMGLCAGIYLNHEVALGFARSFRLATALELEAVEVLARFSIAERVIKTITDTFLKVSDKRKHFLSPLGLHPVEKVSLVLLLLFVILLVIFPFLTHTTYIAEMRMLLHELTPSLDMKL